jgi:hypothetical protein
MKTINRIVLPLLFITVVSCNSHDAMHSSPGNISDIGFRIAGSAFDKENINVSVIRTPGKITAACFVQPGHSTINIEYDLAGKELQRMKINDHGHYVGEYFFEAILAYNKGKEETQAIHSYVPLCLPFYIHTHNCDNGYREYNFLKGFALELFNQLSQQPASNNIRMRRYLPISKN